MRRGILVLAVLLAFGAVAASAIAAGVIPEPPFETNSECLACHDAADPGATSTFVDFAVPGAVDYERCKVCHLNLPDKQVFPGGYTYLMHYHGQFDDCMECHAPGAHDEPFFTFPEGSPRSRYLVSTAYGYFAGTDSIDASPETLHDVHMNPGWVETTFGDPYAVGCSRCHAAASCSACHGDAVPHGDHALPDYPAASYRQADGVAATVAESTCVNEYCHAISAAGTPAFNEPVCADCHSHAPEDLAAAHVPPVEAGFCASCHVGSLDATHAQAAVVVGDSVYESCYVCHRADLGPATADCQVCHSDVHAGMEEAHTPSTADALCASCHPESVEITHQEASTVVDGETYTSCAVCHRIDLGPATADCQSCHGTFVDHTVGAGVHIASGEGCLNCHSADLVVEHANLSPSSCAACHTHEWFPTDGWDNTCKSCHSAVRHQRGGDSAGTGGGGGRR